MSSSNSDSSDWTSESLPNAAAPRAGLGEALEAAWSMSIEKALEEAAELPQRRRPAEEEVSSAPARRPQCGDPVRCAPPRLSSTVPPVQAPPGWRILADGADGWRLLPTKTTPSSSKRMRTPDTEGKAYRQLREADPVAAERPLRDGAANTDSRSSSDSCSHYTPRTRPASGDDCKGRGPASQK